MGDPVAKLEKGRGLADHATEETDKSIGHEKGWEYLDLVYTWRTVCEHITTSTANYRTGPIKDQDISE